MIEKIRIYVRAWLWGVFFNMIGVLIVGIISDEEHEKDCVVSALLGTVVNIVLIAIHIHFMK